MKWVNLNIRDNTIYKTLNNRNSQYLTKIDIVYEMAKSELNNNIKNVFLDYTLHDIDHSIRIANYMSRLIGDPSDYNDLELTLMLMSALLHDIGMAVNEEDQKLLRKDADQPFYSPLGDVLNMPDIKQFDNPQDYYSVLFHELTHATGHKTRLARPEIMELTSYGSKAYGTEELTAEMGAAFLTAYCDIGIQNVTENNAAYINSWLKIIKEDKKMVFKAAAAAQKAVNHILEGN